MGASRPAVSTAPTTLGFKKYEAGRAVEQASAHVGETATLEELIREALRRCPRPGG